ncbi:hypothetical protein NG2371_07003 [Nocardia gamkensis]|nr:hypothetical protein [Nocardia gamkensis]
MAAQRVIDLAQFDAEATNLHLEVRTSQDLDATRTQTTRQIAGSVHARPGTTGLAAERVGHEACRGETSPVQITLRQRGTRQIQLADHAGRSRAQAGIQYEQAESGYRAADGDRLTRHERRAAGRDDGGLGGAVTVDHRAAVTGPPVHQVGAEPVADDHDDAQVRQARGVHRFQRTGSDEHVRDAFAPKQIGEFEPAEHRRRRDDQGGSGGEGEQQFQHRHVEVRRADVHHPRAFRDVVALAFGRHHRAQSGMGDHDTLGPAGRTGGEDDIGGMLLGEQPHPIGVRDGVRGPPPDSLLVSRIVEFDPGEGGAEGLAVGGSGQAERRSGIGHHVGDPVGRIGGIDRHIGGARLGDRPHRQHRLERAPYADGHHVAGAQSSVDQLPRQPRRRFVELPVGQLHGVGGITGRREPDRHRVGGGFHRGGEQLPEEGSAGAATAISTRRTAIHLHSRTLSFRRRRFSHRTPSIRPTTSLLARNGVADTPVVLSREVQSACPRPDSTQPVTCLRHGIRQRRANYAASHIFRRPGAPVQCRRTPAALGLLALRLTMPGLGGAGTLRLLLRECKRSKRSR